MPDTKDAEQRARELLAAEALLDAQPHAEDCDYWAARGKDGENCSCLRDKAIRAIADRPKASVGDEAGIYTASRASLPERSAMWRQFRAAGTIITASWIDEAGDGETECFTELWDRIAREIAAAERLVLYAEPDDFPLKGALIEVGIALGMGKPVTVCLPGVEVQGRTHRPIGSWIEHRLVTRNDDITAALASANSQTGEG